LCGISFQLPRSILALGAETIPRASKGLVHKLLAADHRFCKRHATIRCTPAMGAGIEKSQWTTSDLVEMTEGK
jgi:hypothetical protein